MLGKKSSEKSAKNVFYIQTNILQKNMGKKTRVTIFPEAFENARKQCWEKKSSEKSAKNVFYIHTNIVTKKWGEKTSETIFPETHE